MAFDFPSSPTIGQMFTPAGGANYTWNGYGWASGAPSISIANQNLINGKLVESHAANVATFAVKTRAGADPSVNDPVMVALPDGSVLTITAALSFSTGASTFGMIANTPHRLWFAVGSSAGAPILMARLCAAGTNAAGHIVGFDSRGVTNTTVTGNNAYTTYTNSAGYSNIPYKIIAFADYESGLATPGTWAVSPTRIIQVGPQTPLPGSILSIRQAGPFGQTSNNTNSYVNTNTAIAGSLSSPMNAFLVRALSQTYVTGGAPFFYIINRDSFSARSFLELQVIGGSTPIDVPISLEMVDFPMTTAAKTYSVAFRNNDGSSTGYLPGSASDGFMTLTELMA